MINECSQHALQKAFINFFEGRATDAFENHKNMRGKQLHDFKFRNDQIETCLVQFRALGLIGESVRTRSVKDTTTYWRLKPYGDYLMTQLRALRRTAAPHPPPKGKVAAGIAAASRDV